jgi:drug/metabolite transporter (DMT)-like permease
MEGFTWASLFAVQGVIGLGLRDLATRRVPRETSSLQLSFWAFLVLIPASVLMMWGNGETLTTPTLIPALYFAVALLIGIGAYYAIVTATRLGDISFVSPFRYSRIVFALVIGMAVFAERPDALTLIGAAVIVGSGLYTLWREQVQRAKPS